LNIDNLPQNWPLPKRPRPIIFIGAGGIVRSCHIPAYRKAKFPLEGLVDLDLKTAWDTARAHKIHRIFNSIHATWDIPGVVYDVAVPATGIESVLRQVPKGSAVLIQKPFGVDLKSAKRLLALCRKRKLTAAVNFQLRYAPNMMALRALLAKGALGRVTDVEVRVNLFTPWGQWKFLEGIPRMEILYHSIHYLDLLRSLFGEPKGVVCRTYKNPRLPKNYADAGHSALLDYGPFIRCSLHTNHAFDRGPRHSMVELKVEGTKGVAVAHMQQKLNSPEESKGHDALEVSLGSAKWRKVRLKGDWFPDAFQGPMANLQRYVSGEDKVLHTRVEDAVKTMALLEAMYTSSRTQGTKIP